MKNDKNRNMNSLKLYTSMKFEIEKLIDQMLAPVNIEREEEVDFPFDMFIEKDMLVIEIEMPGLEKENVNLEGIDKFIEISGDKNTIKKKYRNCICIERANGVYKKVIFIDQPVNLQKATAQMDAGVLTITCPVVDEKRCKKIIDID